MAKTQRKTERMEEEFKGERQKYTDELARKEREWNKRFKEEQDDMSRSARDHGQGGANDLAENLKRYTIHRDRPKSLENSE